MSDFCPPYIPGLLPPRVGFLATRSTNQPIASATPTPVTLPNEGFDSDSFFTPNNYYGAIPSGKAGVYAISARVVWGTVTATDVWLLRIIAAGISYDWSGVPWFNIQSGGITVPLSVGEAVALEVYQSSGVTLNLASARLSAYLVSQ